LILLILFTEISSCHASGNELLMMSRRSYVFDVVLCNLEVCWLIAVLLIPLLRRRWRRRLLAKELFTWTPQCLEVQFLA